MPEVMNTTGRVMLAAIVALAAVDAAAPGGVDISEVVVDGRLRRRAGGGIANEILLREGESPGWNKAAEGSVFAPQRLTATVPPLAKAVRINFVSHTSVGVIGIAVVEMAIQRVGESSVSRHALPGDLGGRPFRLMATPVRWEQSGNRVSQRRALRDRGRAACRDL